MGRKRSTRSAYENELARWSFMIPYLFGVPRYLVGIGKRPRYGPFAPRSRPNHRSHRSRSRTR